MKIIITAILILFCLSCKKEKTDNTSKLLSVLAIANSSSRSSSTIYSCPTCTVSTIADLGYGFILEGATQGIAGARRPSGIVLDSNGIIYTADYNGSKIRKVTATGVVTTFAGSGNTGSIDGIGIAATFKIPYGLTIDSNGIIYVADSGNNKIRKITPDGVVTTLAGSGSVGSADGNGNSASFDNPGGLAIDANGIIYVADTGNNKIRKITSSGVVTTLAGSGSVGSTDGNGTSASFYFPNGIAVDSSSGKIYIADSWNNKIRKVTTVGDVTTFAGSGSPGYNDGNGIAASFDFPVGLALGNNGIIYIADRFSNKIRKITPDGVVTTLAGSGSNGSTDGTSNLASFSHPDGVAIDSIGNVYVADTDNSKIRKITLP